MSLQTLTLNSDYGLVRTTGFKTVVKPLGGGYEQRAGKGAPDGLRRYKIVLNERLIIDLDSALYQFYKARHGRLERFNITDPLDSTTVTVRFTEDELSEEMICRLLESTGVEVEEVNS